MYPHPSTKRCQSTTADELREEALLLADSGAGIGDAASVLLKRADRRIPVVMAKRMLQSSLDEGPTDPSTARALEILQAMLERGSWAE
jgi:hypothetical protein